jgi:hypothetical protein
MCLVTTQKEALIAEQDITVYKLLKVREYNEDYESPRIEYLAPYWDFHYNLGELYKTTIEEIPEEYYGDKCAFDKFDSNVLCNLFKDSEGNPNWNPSWYTGKEPATDVKYFGAGYHACTTVERLTGPDYYGESKIFECTIPAGSEYYLNPSGLIVSNQIIINNQIN